MLCCRQHKLDQLLEQFDRVEAIKTWLTEKVRLVSQDNFGYDSAAVEAATKKHEAMETDVKAYERRLLAAISVEAELQNENYQDIERINRRFV